MGDGRLEAGLDQACRDRLKPWGAGAVEFAERKAVSFHYLHDAWRDQVRCRIDDATDDSRRVDMAGDGAVGVCSCNGFASVFASVFLEIPPRDTVLHGDDAGLLMKQCSQLGRDGGNRVRLPG